MTTFTAVEPLKGRFEVGIMEHGVRRPLRPEEVDATVAILNRNEDRSSWKQYFRVDVERGLAVPYLYNLTIWRLMKAKEAQASGFGIQDKWVLVGELKDVDDRNAQCIISMLETPRPPLQNKEEESRWAATLERLGKPKIDLPSTVPSALVCTKPPSGWHCTRGEGHTGACAAQKVIVTGSHEDENTGRR